MTMTKTIFAAVAALFVTRSASASNHTETYAPIADAIVQNAQQWVCAPFGCYQNFLNGQNWAFVNDYPRSDFGSFLQFLDAYNPAINTMARFRFKGWSGLPTIQGVPVCALRHVDDVTFSFYLYSSSATTEMHAEFQPDGGALRSDVSIFLQPWQSGFLFERKFFNLYVGDVGCGNTGFTGGLWFLHPASEVWIVSQAATIHWHD